MNRGLANFEPQNIEIICKMRKIVKYLTRRHEATKS